MIKVINVVMFAVGATAGSIATWKLLKSKYEQIAQEEIDSVKETFYRRRQKENDIEKTEQHKPSEKPDLAEYAAKLKETMYTEDSENENEEEEESHYYEPYVISPEEFGELHDYKTVSLTYYADEILADSDTDDIIDDEESVVGTDFSNHFGEYEDDSVFIRNDKLKSDYEILLDARNYTDVVNRPPHQVE